MRNKKRERISVLLLILLGLSIGFAALATTLKINGTTIITKNTWNVYWDNIDNEDGVTPTSIDIDDEDENNKDNIVTFSVTLDKPGDYFEFTVDAVNAGTIDAEVLTIEKKYNDTLIPEVEDPNNRVVPAYLKYEVKYADGTEITAGDKLLKANGNTPTTRTVKVRVEYDRNAVTNSDINNQSGTVSHSFSFSVQYGQATSSGDEEDDSAIAARIAEIEANPDNFRDPEQSVNNQDIGIDRFGNVIDLDLWAFEYSGDDYYYYLKCYDLHDPIYNEETDDYDEVKEITLKGTGEYGNYAMATANENIVNGELQTPIPAYIMLAGTNEFYPVTKIMDVFGKQDVEGWDEPISKYPDIPPTVKTIGEHTFRGIEAFETLEIPKQIEYIDYNAFSDAFNPSGENNTLTFENGSQIKKIGMSAFDWNHLKNIVLPSSLQKIEASAFRYNELSGSLTLPNSITSIDCDAFTSNNLTSVSVSSSTEFCLDYYEEDSYGDLDGPFNAFDSGVTIIRY